ncbi:MAG: secondary thiamine-phosphate synthase enzyme YjbQ [Thermanaeromonas sp.]|uniref:secondary thiamine-phosphate synthase enzyme YjbQ n=1 Tax=Thermanaeromonas sp. TaxID=2003697 RepID=UPI00243B8ED7|nr:secondary thiamine-phosphate synthase enzyme YjbQ [Thermanaeromonas sp.]MCG0278319.1 secondary thiamine-phosphate synthase enzyme YjbQ [Thermanaeromonas sp.]
MLQLTVHSRQRVELINITLEVQALIDQHKISSGACLLFVPHTTAGIIINENADPDVVRDILTTLLRLVPQHGDYRHLEGNSDAHIKAVLTGSSVIVPISQGRLQLGTWQAIYFAEFDGPRRRQVLVSFLAPIS